MGYDGARFHGVQPQPGVRTAGATLLARIVEATGHYPRAVSFAARTDAGVHAEANLVSLRLPHLPGVEHAMADLCIARDDGLRGIAVQQLPYRAMARSMTCGKHYRYEWALNRAAEGPAAWRIVPAMDVEAMQRAAASLVGTHHFGAFRAAGCNARAPVKTLVRAEVRAAGATLQLHLEGDAFLRKMARIIAGTLAEVGCGLRPASSVTQLLHTKLRDDAGVTAPARGLTLMAVHCHAAWGAPAFLSPVEACA